MSTVDNYEFVKNIIKHDGYYNGDCEDAPDNPPCILIIEYTNAWDRTTWGLIFRGDRLTKYDASNYVRNPHEIWRRK